MAKRISLEGAEVEVVGAVGHWDGFYDVEIFSDNGAFGAVYPDSLWDLQATDLAARARERFMKCWHQRTVTA